MGRPEKLGVPGDQALMGKKNGLTCFFLLTDSSDAPRCHSTDAVSATGSRLDRSPT